MSGLPFFEGFAPVGMRTMSACLESVEQELAFSPYPGFDPCDGDDPRVELSRSNPCRAVERRFDVAMLANETIVAVEPAPGGYRIRCGSGTVIHVDRGHTFDAAGLAVIEP